MALVTNHREAGVSYGGGLGATARLVSAADLGHAVSLMELEGESEWKAEGAIERGVSQRTLDSVLFGDNKYEGEGVGEGEGDGKVEGEGKDAKETSGGYARPASEPALWQLDLRGRRAGAASAAYASYPPHAYTGAVGGGVGIGAGSGREWWAERFDRARGFVRSRARGREQCREATSGCTGTTTTTDANVHDDDDDDSTLAHSTDALLSTVMDTLLVPFLVPGTHVLHVGVSALLPLMLVGRGSADGAVLTLPTEADGAGGTAHAAATAAAMARCEGVSTAASAAAFPFPSAATASAAAAAACMAWDSGLLPPPLPPQPRGEGVAAHDDGVNGYDDGYGGDDDDRGGFDLVVVRLPVEVRDPHNTGGADAGAGEMDRGVVRLTRSIIAQSGRGNNSNSSRSRSMNSGSSGNGSSGSGSSGGSNGGVAVVHVLVLGACAGGATDWVLPTGEAWTLVADVCPEGGADVGARLFRSAASLASAGGGRDAAASGGGGDRDWVSERHGLLQWHACRTALITRRREGGQRSGILAVRELVCRRDGNVYV